MTIADRPQRQDDDAGLAARIDGVRARFLLKFTARLQLVISALPRMTGSGSDAANAVADAYRWLHDVGGISATIGFPDTGRVAQSSDAMLVGPFRAQCGLSSDELALLTGMLESLRIAGLREAHSTESHQRPAS